MNVREFQIAVDGKQLTAMMEETESGPGELGEAASIIPTSTVSLLEGADHGFQVLKSSGLTKEQVWGEATDSMIAWIRDGVGWQLT